VNDRMKEIEGNRKIVNQWIKNREEDIIGQEKNLRMSDVIAMEVPATNNKTPI
jgi:hypothetical protein